MKRFFIVIISLVLFVFFVCDTLILKSYVIENCTNYKEEQTKLLCDVNDCM